MIVLVSSSARASKLTTPRWNATGKQPVTVYVIFTGGGGCVLAAWFTTSSTCSFTAPQLTPRTKPAQGALSGSGAFTTEAVPRPPPEQQECMYVCMYEVGAYVCMWVVASEPHNPPPGVEGRSRGNRNLTFYDMDRAVTWRRIRPSSESCVRFLCLRPYWGLWNHCLMVANGGYELVPTLLSRWSVLRVSNQHSRL